MKSIRLFSKTRYSDAAGPGSRGLEAAAFFGLKKHQFRRRIIMPEIDISVKTGQVCLITGPSGTGKTLLLKSLYACAGSRAAMASSRCEPEKFTTLVDASTGSAFQAMKRLYRCGLRDAYAMLSHREWLSGGERFRFSLSQALAADAEFIFCDEFCSSLDDVSAVSVSRCIRSLADAGRVGFVLAGWREDIIELLSPEIIISRGSPAGLVIRRCGQ